MTIESHDKVFKRALLQIAIGALVISTSVWTFEKFWPRNGTEASGEYCGLVFFAAGYLLVLPLVIFKNRLLHKANTNTVLIKDRVFITSVLLLFALLNLALPFLLLLTGDGMRNIGGLVYRLLTMSWLGLWLVGSFFLFVAYISFYILFCVLPKLARN